MPRTTSLTPTTQRRIVKAITDGATIVDAARAAGIGESTLHKWMRLGRTGKTPYRAFQQACLRARVAAKLTLIRYAYAGASTDGHLALKILRARYPKERAMERRLKIEGGLSVTGVGDLLALAEQASKATAEKT